MHLSKLSVPLAVAVMGVVGGATGCADETGASQESDLTSKSAEFLELSFSGEVVLDATESESEVHKGVVAQLFYLAGELDKTHGGHGRFGFVELDQWTSEPAGDGLVRVRYDARLPVAWPKNESVPDSYRIVVPLHADAAGLDAFNAKYAHKCGHTEYGQENTWYDFTPIATGCAIDAADVLDTVADVRPNPDVTSVRYPEFPRFWEDGEFRVVLVNGTDGAWSKDPSDPLVSVYLEFQAELQRTFGGTVTQGPTSASIFDDWTLEAPITTYSGGEGKIVITTLLTGQLESAGPDLDARFDEISGDADVLMYGGHSGLSKNIRAMAAKGVVKPQHYQVMILQGCSTFAYLDRSLVERRIEVNGAEEDPDGTRYLDIIATAQPAYMSTNVPTFMAALTHLSDHTPHTYLELLDEMPQSAIPVVAGEEDNPEIAPAP
jgi:hypothetical protein